ncbi:MAG: bifunctional UDP-4-keto-pentose/UDP-xylose synthase, partial [Burkholderiales bacterium]|nr:bifunctional UDP-4-keto-pentose/UDP-xylose synthase [Burkholderiales bacterium]
KVEDTSANQYYGAGYQDVKNRVPKITNTCEELQWQPTITMQQALRHIFDDHAAQLAKPLAKPSAK